MRLFVQRASFVLASSHSLNDLKLGSIASSDEQKAIYFCGLCFCRSWAMAIKVSGEFFKSAMIVSILVLRSVSSSIVPFSFNCSLLILSSMLV